MSLKNIYTIPSGFSFVDVLAKGVMDLAKDDPLSLAQIQILLPTRRGCRSLREAFLKITKGKPLLLPRMSPIGDVNEEELDLFLGNELSQEFISLPPAMPPMQRQFLLAKLIHAKGHGRGIAQDMELAKALATLMDQTYTQDLDLKNLPSLVDESLFADHWQVSLNFLGLISEFWPQILQDFNMIDGADRRNRLLKLLSHHWQKNPPKNQIIAAGSTGSIPSTAALLQTISAMPKGMVVLPGLDQNMDEKSWKSIDDSHPQATLRNLLAELGQPRVDVPIWPECKHNEFDKKEIRNFVSEFMRPPETTDEWQTAKNRFNFKISDFKIERYDCMGPQEEALVIALALRRALEDKQKTAALVTPDRKLARRVTLICKRWGIDIDDSAGKNLLETLIGKYLILLMETICEDIKPVTLLDFCKHSLCTPSSQNFWRSDIRLLDKHLFRGVTFEGGIKGYEQKLKNLEEEGIEYPHKKEIAHQCQKIFGFLKENLYPLIALAQNNSSHPLDLWVKTHLECAERFCPKDILWDGQSGETVALFLSDLASHGHILPALNATDYLALLISLMNPLSIRPKFGLHPRLMILGQLEARLLEPDVMIVSGLNEGTWPQKPTIDPWMSRPMRKKFGLPSQERSIGLSAHDFAQSFCADEVIITRSTRVDGTPTIPSRWLSRMDTFIQALDYPKDIFQKDKTLLSIARAIDSPNIVLPPAKRPEPRPPLSVRPRKLSVTKIENWINDPYSIYARYILNLKPLDDVEQDLNPAIRGTIVHDALFHFYTAHGTKLPTIFFETLMGFIIKEMDKIGIESHTRSLWIPRLEKMATWLESQDKNMRQLFKPYILEGAGQFIIENKGDDFTIICRADRIDIGIDGKSAAIIDYKSGGSYSASGMENGILPQLPLEGLILDHKGFDTKKSLESSMLSYWVLNGSGEGGKIQSLKDPLKIKNAIENAHLGLVHLIEKFDIEDTAYYSLPRLDKAPKYNDYEHLARVKEWTTLDDFESYDDEESAA